MKAADLIDAKVKNLLKRELRSLVPPLLRLRDVIGEIELDEPAEAFVAWILCFDHSAIDGLTVLIGQVRSAQRFEILSRTVATSAVIDRGGRGR